MRLVITGASGFLGKNLIKHVSSNDVDFVRLLDLSTQEIQSDLEFEFDSHSIDLANSELDELISEGDTVIHLAWRSNPAVTGADIQAELDLNWQPTKNLIDICARKGAKLIFISSGGTVYGKSVYSPMDEEHETNPISAYGQVKLKVEEEILKQHKESGLKYLILRPSNLYGPGFSIDKGLGVIGHWVRMIKEEKSLLIVGDGEQVRDYIHVDDLCNAIMSCLNVDNEIFNIGTGEGVSLNQLKEIFEEVVGRQINSEFLDSRTFDVLDNTLSIDKIQKTTGWNPSISLQDGIKNLLSED